MDISASTTKAIELAGGVTRVASVCGVSVPAVSRWKSRGRIPPGHVLDVERMVDSAVTRYELRPDVYGGEGGE